MLQILLSCRVSKIFLPTSRHLCCWELHLFVAPATAAERRTKVENLFCCSIVNVKLGQKLNSVTAVERRFASHPNSTNAFVVRIFSFFIKSNNPFPIVVLQPMNNRVEYNRVVFTVNFYTSVT